MSKVEVTTIKLKIDNKPIELTMEQAKKLKEALDQLFTTHIHYEYVNRPYWYYGSTIGSAIGTAISASPCVTYTSGGYAVEVNIC